MRKRLLSFVLVVLMIVSLLPVTALAADIVDSGTCGAEVTWTLDSEGVLTISGSGYMYDYGSSDAPWHGYSSLVKSAVIADGVTSIGSSAFDGCRSLTSVTIPDSVTSIGNETFYNCESLTSVTIPDSVTSIGGSAFGNCKSLTSVTIPNSVTSIGGDAFYNCESLTSVTIPDSVKSIGEQAFAFCASLASVTIPDSVKSIGDGAFASCTSLTGIWVAEGNSHYSSDASGVLFNNDKTTLVQCLGAFAAYAIPDSVTSIGEKAFAGCTSLTSVTIPDSVTSIGGDAFYNCTSLTDVYYAGSEAQWKAISISSTGNNGLLTANIHYNYVSHTHSVYVTEMFTDVSHSWADDGIQYCVAYQLMSGVGDNLFAPKMTTTRAQIVQILYNLEGEPKVSGTMPFTDLTQNWYKDAVLWSYQTGVVVGTSATTFEPDQPVTREQIAVILMEYVTKVLKLERTWTPADLSVFPDAGSVSDWAKDALADAVALGLISGASNGGVTYLNPQGSATREQVATILMEFCKNVKK